MHPSRLVRGPSWHGPGGAASSRARSRSGPAGAPAKRGRQKRTRRQVAGATGAMEDRSRVRQDARMIYNTEIFEVSDVGEFTRALERLRGPMTEAGGTDLRIYRSVDDPTKVLAAMSWPDAESCRAFAREHEGEVKSILRPVLTSHQPEDLWEEI